MVFRNSSELTADGYGLGLALEPEISAEDKV
jgi:hypothetical protein